MYLGISLVFLVISFLLFKKASGSMNLTRLNILSWLFYKDLFLFNFVGCVLVVYDLADVFILRTLSSEVRYYGWLAILYCMIMLPIGIIAANKMLKIRSMASIFKRYCDSPLVEDENLRLPLYFLTLLSIASTIYTYWVLEYVPIVGVFQGLDPISLAIDRYRASTILAGRLSYIREITGVSLSTLLTYTACTYWQKTRSRKDFYWFLISLLTSICILTYNIEKGPIINFILGFLILMVLIHGRLKKKYIALIFIIVIIAITLMQIYIMGKESFGDLFLEYDKGVTGRILTGQVGGIFASLEIYPQVLPHIGFEGILPGFLFTSSATPSDRSLMEIFLRYGVEKGTSGAMSSLFIGEAWANFGLIGLIVAPFYVGFWIGIFNGLILKATKAPLYVGLLSYLSVGLPIYRFSEFILNRRLIGLLVLLFFARFVAFGIKGKYRRLVGFPR